MYRKKKTKVFTYESEIEIDKFDILAFSVAYETEIMGFIEIAELSNIPYLYPSEKEIQNIIH